MPRNTELEFRSKVRIRDVHLQLTSLNMMVEIFMHSNRLRIEWEHQIMLRAYFYLETSRMKGVLQGNSQRQMTRVGREPSGLKLHKDRLWISDDFGYQQWPCWLVCLIRDRVPKVLMIQEVEILQKANLFLKKNSQQSLKIESVETIRCHYTSIRMAWPKSKILTAPNIAGGVEQQELLLISGGNARWCSDFGRQFSGFLQE